MKSTWLSVRALFRAEFSCSPSLTVLFCPCCLELVTRISPAANAISAERAADGPGADGDCTERAADGPGAEGDCTESAADRPGAEGDSTESASDSPNAEGDSRCRRELSV